MALRSRRDEGHHDDYADDPHDQKKCQKADHCHPAAPSYRQRALCTHAINFNTRYSESYDFTVSRRCGARMRTTGLPCQAQPVRGLTKAGELKRRCRWHGGLSTGPRTAEGKARIADAQRQRWARWRLAIEDLTNLPIAT